MTDLKLPVLLGQPGTGGQASDYHTTNLLAILAAHLQPKVIVEAGTYHGHTVIAIARALLAEDCDFHIWTAETNKNCHETAIKNAGDAGVRDSITFIHGDYSVLLDALNESIDLAYMDNGYGDQRRDAVFKTLEHMSDWGILVVDDMDHPSHWGNQEYYHDVRNKADIWLPYNRGIVLMQKRPGTEA